MTRRIWAKSLATLCGLALCGAAPGWACSNFSRLDPQMPSGPIVAYVVVVKPVVDGAVDLEVLKAGKGTRSGVLLRFGLGLSGFCGIPGSYPRLEELEAGTTWVLALKIPMGSAVTKKGVQVVTPAVLNARNFVRVEGGRVEGVPVNDYLRKVVTRQRIASK